MDILLQIGGDTRKSESDHVSCSKCEAEKWNWRRNTHTYVPTTNSKSCTSKYATSTSFCNGVLALIACRLQFSICQQSPQTQTAIAGQGEQVETRTQSESGRQMENNDWQQDSRSNRMGNVVVCRQGYSYIVLILRFANVAHANSVFILLQKLRLL